MHQIQFWLGFRPRSRWGSLSAPPDPLAGFQGSTSTGREGKSWEIRWEREGEVRKKGTKEGKGGWEKKGRGAYRDKGPLTEILNRPLTSGNNCWNRVCFSCNKLPVLSEHQYAQRSQRGQSVDLFQLVVVEVQKDETTQSVHVLNTSYGVVLEVQQTQLVLGLQLRTRRQTTPTTSQCDFRFDSVFSFSFSYLVIIQFQFRFSFSFSFGNNQRISNLLTKTC